MSTWEERLERIKKVGKNFAAGFSISAPVGDWAKGAKNDPADVETVQLLLEHAAKVRKRKELNPKGVDGQISRLAKRSNTVKAIHAFQRTFMTASDGLVEPKGRTLEMLHAELETTNPTAKSAARSVMQAPQPGDGKPAWLQAFFNSSSLLPATPRDLPVWVSIAEDELGEKEIKGKEHNPRILEYHKTTDGAKKDETPWCASFVNWALEKAGYEGTDSSASHSWKKWGDGIPTPALGCVAFIDWGKVDEKKKGKGHVGFVVGKTANNRIVLLGGNQSNQVRYTAFKESLIQAYRVPAGYQPDPKLYTLPILEVAKDGGGFSATR